MEVDNLSWLYVEDIPLKGEVKLNKDESRHLKVVRHNEGDNVALFDGKGTVALTKIIGKDKVTITNIKKIKNNNFLTIATAVPKGDRFDWLLQKLTELGVSRIIPLKTERSVVEPRDAKQKRCQRIIIEACKQSKQSWFPELDKFTSFSKILMEKHDLKVLLVKGTNNIDNTIIGKSKTILAVIGPEGGFTEEEKQAAINAGFKLMPVSKNTLRIETAAISVAAILNNIAQTI